MAIGVRRSFGVEAREIAAASRAALDVPLADEAELWIARPAGIAIAIGAFQRSTGGAAADPIVRRGSGGPAVRMGEGTLWLALVLPRLDALVACDAGHIVNRHVRPLLRALTKCGALAHFFGRDWISVGHRPAAWVGFGHDRASGRAMVEAFVARETPFDVGPRESFMGKEPGTLASILGSAIDEERLAFEIARAYADAYGHAAIDRGPLPAIDGDDDDPAADPPWSATIDEIIGPLGAGPDASGRFRVGGDLLVSRDALASLEASLASARDDEVGAAVDAALGAPGVALDGVRSLTSVRGVILAARARDRQNRA
jgi:hypothetical protein